MAVPTVTSVNVKQAVPFFGVTSMESSLRFYVDGLGFKMKNYWVPDREDALALYREFKSRGIQTRIPFVGNGLWVVPLTDPDGYRLEFPPMRRKRANWKSRLGAARHRGFVPLMLVGLLCLKRRFISTSRNAAHSIAPGRKSRRPAFLIPGSPDK